MAGFLEKNITAAVSVLHNALVTERWAGKRGLLQPIDARIKIVLTFLVILGCSLTTRLSVLVSCYVAASILAAFSGIGFTDFTKRVWFFIPLFSGLIAVPALFLTPGIPIASWGSIAITRQGAVTALFLLLRVSTSISFTVLLILTTTWNGVIDAFVRMKLPAVFVSLLAITYRYLLLLIRTVLELFLARKSRVIGVVTHRHDLRFVSRSVGYLFMKSLHLADGVQMAMTSRGQRIHEGCDKESTYTKQPAPAFELKDVRFTYPDGVPGVAVEALDIPAGSCNIIMGPNGSGKSTLLKILDGLLFPQEGGIKTFGEILSEKRLDNQEFRHRFRSQVGLVFQDPDIQCFSPTVRDELAFGPLQKGLDEESVALKVDEVMRLLGIEGIAERYPYRLSGGEKKRVALASVLTVDPEVYLMDEPTANLDPATEGILIDFMAELKRNGRTLIIATQDTLLARHIGERAVILGPGKELMTVGSVETVLTDRGLLERAGLAHIHRTPHQTSLAGHEHTHYTEEMNE
ncbi:MAG: cobalt ECF transporter T component CbiQ [bacterium]|nr:MAG: cobalt ECF transporter T component CbiQ [bacterium]